MSLERGTDGDSPIEINSTTPVKAEPTWITSDLFELYEEDNEILASSRWLNDRIIGAAQKILEQQCGDAIKGWQCPLYEQSPSKFKAIKDGEEFAQIILVGKSHWIAVSNVGCKAGVLDVLTACTTTLACKHRNKYALSGGRQPRWQLFS